MSVVVPRFVVGLAASVVMMAGLWSPVAASDRVAAQNEVAEWSRQVWSNASGAAGRSDRAVELLLRPPASAEDAGLGDLTSNLARRRDHIEYWETKRQAGLAEVRTAMQSSLDKGDLRVALKSANELFELSPDKQAVLSDQSIRDLTALAETRARQAEAEGRWLEAQSLYSRLHWLHEEQATYKKDVNRLGQRLLMLRLYAPEKLHDMRNAERIAEKEEALPPFNRMGEDWQAKLKGIRPDMIVQAIGAAGAKHVEGVAVGSMLAGGYQNVRTLLTTSDLAAAFPGLNDPVARTRMLSEVDRMIARFDADPKRASFQDVRQSVVSLLSTNRDTVKIPDEALLHEFGNGASNALDEFSDFIWPDELSKFQKTTEGNFPGVGIHITLDDALQLKVVAPVEGTPAARAGIRSNDLIRKINDESTLGIALQQAVDRITGPVGSKVTLSVERQGVDGMLDFTMTRAVIPIYSVKGWERSGARETDWDYMIDHENRIGYIRITQFTRDTTTELRAALDRLKRDNVSGLILDLRYNPGGLLDEAVNVANAFVERGMIVSQENRGGQQQDAHRASPSRLVLGKVPVVVLVNTGSASASEIVAGCLQDHRRGVLVGDRSFGKGSVQNVFPVGDGNAMFKLTTQYYKLPNGRLIHRRDGSREWGVEPDVRVEMLPDQISDALKLRQDADVGVRNRTAPAGDENTPPDPRRLITEGIDPQLETALLLLQSQTVVSRATGAPTATALN